MKKDEPRRKKSKVSSALECALRALSLAMGELNPVGALRRE
jgi:hypothetical protein